MSPARSIRVYFHSILRIDPDSVSMLKLGNEKAPPQGGPAWNGLSRQHWWSAGPSKWCWYDVVLAKLARTRADKLHERGQTVSISGRSKKPQPAVGAVGPKAAAADRPIGAI